MIRRGWYSINIGDHLRHIKSLNVVVIDGGAGVITTSHNDLNGIGCRTMIRRE